MPAASSPRAALPARDELSVARALSGGSLAAALLLALGSCNLHVIAAAAPPDAVPVPASSAPPSQAQLPARQSGDFAFIGAFTQGGWIKGVAPAGTEGLALHGKPVEVEPDGRFFAAFDRDAAPVAELVARRGNFPVVRRSLAISPRGWMIEHINTPFHPPKLPSAEFARIRSGELAQIGASRRVSTDAAGWRQDFIWPVKGRVSGRFGAQRIYQGKPGSYHSGMDIAAAQGAPFIAPADGVVVLAASAPFTLEGNLLIIDHGAGLSSAFLHASKLTVRDGDRVRQGQLIGTVGMTGRATGPHLHWALKWREARLDPLLFVALGN